MDTTIKMKGIIHKGTDRMGQFTNTETTTAEKGAPFAAEIFSHNLPGFGIRTEVEAAGIAPPKYSLILPEEIPVDASITISTNETGNRVITINNGDLSEQAILPKFGQSDTS